MSCEHEVIGYNVSCFLYTFRCQKNKYMGNKLGFIGIWCLLTCFWLLYFLGQMVRLTSQLEGSGVEGKRTCPPLSPQWSPLPQLPLAGLVFLEEGKLDSEKLAGLYCRSSVFNVGFFPLDPFHDPEAAMAVSLLWTYTIQNSNNKGKVQRNKNVHAMYHKEVKIVWGR